MSSSTDKLLDISYGMKEVAQEDMLERETVVRGRPYTAFGEIMDEMARKQNIRGPHRIANYIRGRMGSGPTGVAVAKWMYGESTPKPDNVEAFAIAFELSGEEKARLAYVYTFRLPAAA